MVTFHLQSNKIGLIGLLHQIIITMKHTKNNQIAIRKSENIAHIQEVSYNTWPNTFKYILSDEQIAYMLNLMYSEATLTRQIQHEGHQFYIAYEKDKPLAFVGLQMHYPNSTFTKIHKLYVLPSAQKRGIGAQLIQRVAEIAQENGCNTLTLNVNRHNIAVTFYQKDGWTISREEDIDIGNNYWMNDYVMEKPIP